MKKLNAKFIVSAIIAAAMASATAVSAGAANYYHAPVYAPVSGSAATSTTTPSTTTNTDTKTEESTTGTVASDDAVTSAIKAGKAVDLKVADGKATVSEAAIGAIEKAVTFNVDTDDIDYTVTIDPADIKEVKAINLAMAIEVAEDDATGASCVIITPAQKGDFGMTIQITLPAAAFEGIDLDAAELYYVDDNGNTTVVDGGLTVNSDKSVTIKISHASYYVIADVDLTESGAVDAGLEGDDDDDDDTDVTIDENNTNTNTGKDDTSVVVNGNGSDSNPVTGTTLALGSLAVFAAAAAITSKKRK
jgi:hypothetical protein